MITPGAHEGIAIGSPANQHDTGTSINRMTHGGLWEASLSLPRAAQPYDQGDATLRAVRVSTYVSRFVLW